MGPSGHLAPGPIASIAIGSAVGIISALVPLLYIIRRHRIPKNSPSELPPHSTQELPGLLSSPREELSNKLAAVKIIELPGQSSEKSPGSTIESSWTG